MAQARITKQPYGNLSCDLFCCTSRAPWQINSDGGPAHLAKRLCDEHARDLIRTLPDEFAAELGAAVLAKIQAGGQASAVLLDMLRAVQGEAFPGTPPDVSLVVAEVKNGTDWGNALVESLLPVLEAPSEGEEAKSTLQSGGTSDLPPTEKPGDEDGKAYTIKEDGSVVCVCGKVYEGATGLTNWRKHKPHCKGPKEGKNDA